MPNETQRIVIALLLAMSVARTRPTPGNLLKQDNKGTMKDDRKALFRRYRRQGARYVL
jgi:hypothetical protein